MIAKPRDQLERSSRPFPIIVKTEVYERYARGEKTAEYRRHRTPYVERVLYPSRPVVIRYTRNATGPTLYAKVVRFEALPLSGLAADQAASLRRFIPDLTDSEEIAVVHLRFVITVGAGNNS
jgi:hypothetical protein